MSENELRNCLENQIVKPDGSRKKVILYVINELSFLKSGDKMLQKLEDNFEVFEENRDSIIVVFSIQPGTDDKLKLFNEGIIDKYKNIVHKYEIADFCIVSEFDDTESIYDICDAYYGDSGLTSWKFTKMNKPVMIQNADVE